MSRFVFDDSWATQDNWQLIAGRFEAARKAVLHGRPMFRFLEELEQVLLTMPHKRLITGAFCNGEGCCLVGAAMYRRRVSTGMAPKVAWQALIDLTNEAADGGNHEWSMADAAARDLGITTHLAYLLAEMNDETWDKRTPEERWERALSWVQTEQARLQNEFARRTA